MFISNEVKALCAKNISMAEDAKKMRTKNSELDDLWNKMFDVSNVFEQIYMAHMGRKAYKIRVKAQVMLAVVNGFPDENEPKATRIARAAKAPSPQNPYISPPEAMDLWKKMYEDSRVDMDAYVRKAKKL